MSFDMHLKFEGGPVEIKGASKHSKHQDEVPVLAWSWGVSNSADLHQSATSSGGKAHVQDISVTKYVDTSSNALLQACATGARIEKVVLTLNNATGEQTDYLTIELSNGVMVTSVSTGGSGGEDRLTENITLHFGKFLYKFTEQDEKGEKVKDKEFTYDIQAVNKA